MVRYDGEHKAKTRERLVDEAAQAIRVHGPEGVSVAEVMARAGLTHGGFYAHFASKEDLVAAALAQTFSDGAGLVAETVGALSPRAALAAYIRAYLSRSHRDAPERGCPLPSLTADLARSGGEARAVFAAGVERLTGRLHSLLQEAGIADAEAVAGSMLSEMIGAVALARALPDPDASTAVLTRSRRSLIRRLGLEEETAR